MRRTGRVVLASSSSQLVHVHERLFSYLTIYLLRLIIASTWGDYRAAHGNSWAEQGSGEEERNEHRDICGRRQSSRCGCACLSGPDGCLWGNSCSYQFQALLGKQRPLVGANGPVKNIALQPQSDL